MRRFTRISALAAVTAAVAAPAGYSATYVHSPGLNPYRYEEAFNPTTSNDANASTMYRLLNPQSSSVPSAYLKAMQSSTAVYMHSPGGNPTAYLQATGSQPTTSSPVRLITDTLAPGGGSGNGVTVAASASSFSWADAGIGAGCVAALVLLIALVRTARPAQIRRVAL